MTTMTTLATTETAQEVLAVVDVSAMEDKDPISSLIKVLNRFGSANDFLSKRLFRWGATVIRYVKTTTDSKEQFRERATKEITSLVTEILVDPIDGSSLVYLDAEPVIERDWVWKKYNHAECYRLFKAVSPLDGKPMEEAPVSHEFVRVMAAWLRHYRFFRPPPESPVKLDGNDASKILVYKKLVALALQLRKEEESQERAMSRMDEQRQQTELAVVSSKRVVEEQERKNAEHQAWLSEQLGQLNNTFERRFQDLADDKARKEEESNREIQELRRQMAADKSLTAGLQSQIDAIVASQARQNELYKQTVADLKAQEGQLRAEIIQKSQDFTRQITASNDAKSRLQVKLDSREADVGSLKKELGQLEAKNQKNEKELEKVNTALARSQQRIQQLQNELDDIDTGICLIS